MKRTMFIFSLIIILVFATNATQAAQDQDTKQTVVLRSADVFTVGHPGYKTAKYFIERLGEISKGTIKVEYFPAQQLGKLKDMLKLASEGLADMTYVPPSYFAGQLPLNTVVILPRWTTATEGTKIYNRLIEKCPELTEEFLKYGVRPILVNTTSQYDVGTVKKPVRAPEDLKGLKLHASGGLFDRIAAKYGIIPVNVSSAETYEATQRGVIEGATMSYPSVKGYRLNELEKYHTLGLRMGGFPATNVINEKKWQSLSEEARQALITASIDTNKIHAEGWDKMTQGLAAQFEKEGMAIYRVTPQERAKWDVFLKDIEDEWLQEMGKKGLQTKAKKVLDEYRKICEEVVK